MSALRSRRHRRTEKKTASPSGWAWFIVGLLIALFFGGAVRALFSERHVRQFIEKAQARETPPFQFSFSSAMVKLADGVWPRLGIEIVNLAVSPIDPCKAHWQAEADRIFLPVNVGEALKGRLRFGQIRGWGIRVDLQSHCNATSTGVLAEEIAAPETENKPPATESFKVTETVRQDVQDFLAIRWPKELKGTSRWLDGFEFRDLSFVGLSSQLPELRISQVAVEVDRDGREARLWTQVFPGPVWEQSVGSDPIIVQVKATTDRFQFSANAPVREGELVVDADLSTQGWVHRGDIRLDFVPASQIAKLLEKLKVITDPFEPHRTWLTGKVSWLGGLNPSHQVSVQGEGIKLTGDPGEVELKTFSLLLENGGWRLRPFAVEFKNFSLQHLLNSLGRKGYSGVIADFGRLSGELKVTDRDNMTFEGHVANLDLTFSRRSIRAHQIVESMKGELALKANRVSGLLNTFSLKGGTLNGLMSFNLDRRLRDGVFQVKVDQLSFQPEVQRLMLGGEAAPFAIYGQGRLMGGEVVNWSGDLGVEFIHAESWKVDMLKARSEFAGGQMALNARANSAEVMPGNSYWPTFKPLFSADEKIGDHLILRRLSGRVEIFGHGGRWRNLMGTTSTGEAVVSSHGNWQNDSTDGLISVDSPRAKMQRWDLSGPWLDLKVAPSVRTARRLTPLGE